MQPWPKAVARDAMEVWGTVRRALPDATFRVRLDNGHRVLACVGGGATRLHALRLAPGDRVTVEVFPGDLRRGRITYRMK
jgi:translation initiation factor IF-1